ncbi:MAG TPA: Gfo/Idh/MocA family oxidoreductase [Terriglobales bacterium]
MIRFGIAGFGLHAVKRLMPGFAKASRCRVSALSRRNWEKATQSAKEYEIPDVFATTEELCRSPEVDAVFVATPNAIHLADVLTAVRCGKPVLCEKPMGMNAGQCREMIEAAHQASVLLGVAQVFRFEESTAWFREQIAGGKIGRPVFARSEFSVLAGPEHPRKWMRNRSMAGGGPIADVGVHCIDALRFVLQDEVTRVSALGRYDPPIGDVETTAELVLEFAGGTLATVAVSFEADYRTPFEVIGSEGSVRGEDAFSVDKPLTLELRRQNAIETRQVSNASAYAAQVDAFAAAVEGTVAFPVPGEEGWQNQRVLDAAYRSLGSGKTEAV